MLYKIRGLIKSEIVAVFEKINSEHLINKTIHYESSKAREEIQEWLSDKFCTPKNTFE